MPRLLRLVPLFLIGTLETAPFSGAQWNPLNPVESFHKGSDGATIFLEKGAPRFQLCTNSMVRVLFSPEREFPKVAEYLVIKSEWPQTAFNVTETADAISLTTAKLKLVVTKKDGVVVFYDSRSNDATDILTVGARKGKYNGVPDALTFRVVFVSKEHGAGVEETRTREHLAMTAVRTK
jgi:hypothetical protein